MKRIFAFVLMLMLLVPALATAAQWNDVTSGLQTSGAYEGGGVKAALKNEEGKTIVEISGGTIKFDELGMIECWPGAAQTEFVFTDCKLDFSASYMGSVYTWAGGVTLRFEGTAQCADMIMFSASEGTENAVINHTKGNIGPITAHFDGAAKLALEGIDPKKTELSVYTSLTAAEKPEMEQVEAAMRAAYANVTLDGAAINPADVFDSLVQITDGSWYYAFYQGTYDADKDAWTFKEI